MQDVKTMLVDPRVYWLSSLSHIQVILDTSPTGYWINNIGGHTGGCKSSNIIYLMIAGGVARNINIIGELTASCKSSNIIYQTYFLE